MPKAQIALTPELAKAKMKIRLAEKVSRLIAGLDDNDANEVLGMAKWTATAEWSEPSAVSAAA